MDKQKNQNQFMNVLKIFHRYYSERPYLKEVDSISLRCTMFDLEDAFSGFYKGIRNYPKFKSKYNRNSYRTNMITSTYKNKIYHNIKLDL